MRLDVWTHGYADGDADNEREHSSEKTEHDGGSFSLVTWCVHTACSTEVCIPFLWGEWKLYYVFLID